MNAILRTRVYEEIFTSHFTFSESATSCKSDCGNYRLSYILRKSAGKTTYLPSLEWIADRRPQAGLELLTLEWELPSHSLDSARIFQHGYQSWSISASHSLEEPDTPPTLDFLRYSQENIYTEHSGDSGHWISEGFVLLCADGEDSKYFAGAIGKGNEGLKFRVLSNSFLKELSAKKKKQILYSSVSAIYDLYRFEGFKGNKIALTPIRISKFAGDEGAFLRSYFSELGKAHRVKIPSSPVPVGWCSWYHYFTKISEKIILQNLNELRKRNLGLKIFQIDDGYQKEIGDWLETNDRFPGGMKLIAEAIRSEKLTPGIWLAPFLVRPKSKFFQKFPEAVLKDREGNPVKAIWNPNWGMDYTYALDVTHPTSREFLATVIKTFVKDYGYTYLKLDFLYAALLPGWTYDRDLSPHKRYVDSIQFIRKVAGKEAFLVGCGAPILPSIGLFDAMRVSCDVAPFWTREKKRILLKDRDALSTERALINDITRSSMHRTLWYNDPDCLLVREKKNKLTEAQVKLMASVMSVSGGMLFVSDELSSISKEREDYLRKALFVQSKCRNKTPIPIGIASNFFPLAMFNPAGFLGIWNPSDQSKDLELVLSFPWDKKNSVDIWTGKSPESLHWDSKKKTLKINLEPWSSYILGPGKLV
ncbi:alpha-galactosidase [Leptospira perolatii]|uniref:Alpha-galactosidase n=1 Tax=Leptospira perolatii TaxID=2023191 RepID=A0A2M9ZNI0_9LEPT|nr:glycoside hydrolase family 36 protein [Leptospira perolatii]PJZ68888.1 alpha-galactosidase [Leptospira perolatii]PJZ73493.1 alpha-galactosidase [Leptospira perolatii]